MVALLLVAAIQGAFLSQVAWGSTYGIWPLLVIVFAVALREVRHAQAMIAIAFAAMVLMCGVPYLIRSERLTYADLEGAPVRSSLRPLRGLTIAGPWLPQFERLVAWTDANIPRGDKILCFPGEDLFYFTTGRTAGMPVLMFDRTINPYDAAELMRIAEWRRVRWVIVKRRMQMKAGPDPDWSALLPLVAQRFSLMARLTNYDIYILK